MLASSNIQYDYVVMISESEREREKQKLEEEEENRIQAIVIHMKKFIFYLNLIYYY